MRLFVLDQVTPDPTLLTFADYDYYDYYDGLGSYFDSNKIPGEVPGGAKASPTTDSAEEAFPNLPDYQGDFDNFPFHLGPAAASPLSPTLPPSLGSTQAVPLGAPGFTFPKLPNLKSSTGFVNVSAFDNLDSSSFGKKEEFPSRLQNHYAFSPPPSLVTFASDKETTPLKTNTVSSFLSTYQGHPSTPTLKDTSRSTPQEKRTRVSILTSSTQNRPVSTLPSSTATLSHPTHSPNKPPLSTQASTRNTRPSHASTSSHSTSTSFTSSSTSLKSQHYTTKLSSTLHTSVPTSTSHRPTRPVFHSLTPFPHPQKSTLAIPTPTRHPNHRSEHHQPEVITAPSLPPLPGQASLQVQQHFHTPPPRRDPPLPWTTHSPPSTSLSDTFAQNFGFDPESVVYESDFQPVKKHPPGPVLAFEVSPSSSRPLNGPLPPHPPRFHHQVPQGPRTATNLGFTNRQVKIDGAEESDEEVEVKAPAGGAPNPIYHHTVAFSESHAPLPLPIPMAPVLPLLGGAASNMPLKPARSSKTPRHRPRTRPRPRPRPQHRPNMGLAGPIGSVSRLGRPQPPPRRLVASLIPLPEDHAVLAPQLVGPSVLQPVFPAPPPPPGRMGDLLPAASSPIYTSDGRPLPPDSIPGPPQLSTPPHQTSDSITGRPQVGPYRGEPPPPVPANVPHLAQFSKQSRPTSQRTAVPMPPLLGTTSQPAEYSPAGSAPRPVVIAAPKDKLTGTFGVTSSVPSPAPPPGTKKTHLTILKDVWAILTQDHPRDDAHPAHAHHHQHHHHQPHLYTNQHLDGFEGEPRRRRDEGD
ncbi:leucine-rich repeat extensin-like protein 5 [Portunus trituberculatus]|uniref:leucine-rich repeat extensin-like protein 5 n=1 Tax=Portunus trituberculatus TaxID=210409 RepID=UPI001E1CE4CA|nr:leucine-rich repeat extensin-like protein 5 [Portunus trituberculatus]